MQTHSPLPLSSIVQDGSPHEPIKLLAPLLIQAAAKPPDEAEQEPQLDHVGRGIWALLKGDAILRRGKGVKQALKALDAA